MYKQEIIINWINTKNKTECGDIKRYIIYYKWSLGKETVMHFKDELWYDKTYTKTSHACQIFRLLTEELIAKFNQTKKIM